ncbi:MAG TPA: GntR family transcriptional regulator [Stellaceae bacterium]|nr:GntR family transcriptional regulator [Stellaceae bacterium]
MDGPTPSVIRSVLNRKLPLWYQVAQSLRAEILARRFEATNRLPTEIELARQYGVSLITLRQALKTIEEEGLISRHRRLGTFVNPAAFAQRPLELLGAVATVFAQQTTEEMTVLEHGVTRLPADLAAQFGDDAPREVGVIRRLRLDGGVPVGYAINYVLPGLAARILPDQLRSLSMTRILSDSLGVEIKRIENTVEAQLASPEVAHLLATDLMSPILLFTGISHDMTGRVVDIARIHYRGDRYKFSVGFDIAG